VQARGIVGTGTSQFGDCKGRLRWFGHVEHNDVLTGSYVVQLRR